MSDPNTPSQAENDDFLAQASHAKERGLLAEFVAFLAENKLWWMAPILIVLGLVGVLFALGATGAMPFLYTLW